MYTHIPDHDQLVTLAQENPERLEQLRQSWVNDIIESAPEETRRRLRGLQFQIDCKRELHSSPLGACLEISRMMQESLGKLNKLMNHQTDQTEQQPEGDKPATVLAFPSAG